jgi:Cys-rich protein (TIGR01571 family)
MICLLCHILAGSEYRAELGLRYRTDVGRYNSTDLFNIRAHDFNTGLFDCFESDGDVFRLNLCGFCCSPVLFAIDASASGFMSFWLALVLTSIFIPIIWVFGFIGRLHLRNRFHMQKSPIGDFCSWFCCYCCSLVQEHKFMREVFSVMRAGTREAEIQKKIPVAQRPTPAVV